MKTKTVRIALSIVFIALFIIFLYISKKVFYELWSALINFNEFHKFFWCLAFSVLGLAVRSLTYIGYIEGKSTDSAPATPYFTIYPILIILFNLVFFSITYISMPDSRFFYTFTAPICFIVGRFINEIELKDLIKK